MPTSPPSPRGAPIRQRPHGALRRGRIETPAIVTPVFIAYADVAGARRALDRINGQLRTAQPQRELLPMLWRFDQLDQPRWREMALHDASRSAAIIVVLSEEMPLHAAAEAWLTRLAEEHRESRIEVQAVFRDEFWSISLVRSAASATTERKRVTSYKKNPAALVTLPDKNLAAHAA